MDHLAAIHQRGEMGRIQSSVPRDRKTPRIGLHDGIWYRQGSLRSHPDCLLDKITLTQINGRRGVLSARCQQQQSYNECFHALTIAGFPFGTPTNQRLSLVEGAK